MSSPNDPVLCCPLPYRVAPVFVQVVSPPLGWSPLTSFLVIWSPSGDARGPSVVFEAVDMPCPGPFHFSHSVDYIYEFCPLPNPDVGPSIFVCDVEHTSFHFGLCGRKFVLCLFGQCPGLCTICHSWQHTGVVHLSFQADGKVAFEDIPVFGVWRMMPFANYCNHLYKNILPISLHDYVHFDTIIVQLISSLTPFALAFYLVFRTPAIAIFVPFNMLTFSQVLTCNVLRLLFSILTIRSACFFLPRRLC